MLSSITARPVLAHVEHPIFGPSGGHLYDDGSVVLFPTVEQARVALDDTGAAYTASDTEGLVVKVTGGYLRPTGQYRRNGDSAARNGGKASPLYRLVKAIPTTWPEQGH